MGAVGHVARMVRRRLVGSLLVVAAIVGLAGGLAGALVSGASRTTSATERLIEATRLPDLLMIGPDLTVVQAAELRRLDGVEAVGLVAVLAAQVDGVDEYFNITADLDGHYGVDIDVSRLLRGRAADPSSASEVVVGERIAEVIGVDVGDIIRFSSYSPEQLAAWRAAGEPSAEDLATFGGPSFELDVVGISRHASDVANDDPNSHGLVLPPGFLRHYAGQIGEHDRLAFIDAGSSPTPEEEGALAEDVVRVGGDGVFLEETGEQAGGPLATTLDFVAMSMLALAAAVALAGTVVGALALARVVARAVDETAALPAIGMTPTERARAITLALTPAGAAAGALAALVMLACSVFIPFGLARAADPGGGLRVELSGLILVAAATAGTVMLLGKILATRDVRRRRTVSSRRRGLVARLSRLGLPVGPLVGVELTAGSGRRGASQLAVAAASVATATCVGAFVLRASIDHLESTPATYGWTWDVVVHDELAQQLVDDPAVEALGLVTTGPIPLDGRPTIVRGVTSLKGPVPLAVVEGRLPERGEIVLGRRTMDDLGVGIGDTVVAEGSARTAELRVVGTAVFAGITDAPEASWGAAVQGVELDAIGIGDTTGTGAAVTLAPGVDGGEFAARVEALSGEAPKSVEEPVELLRLREIEAFPWLLAGFLVTVGGVAVGHAIFATARRRRRDLAVLRSMGLAPTGVVQAVCVQSVLVVLGGAVVGIPLGVAVGQTLWREIAGALGVVVVVDVPWAAIVAVAAGAALTTLALAVVPGRRAAREPLAVALRAE